MRHNQGPVTAQLSRAGLDARLRRAIARNAARRRLPPGRVVDEIERFLDAPPWDPDVPLAEMRHRVKNEMQLLSSAMRNRRRMLDATDRDRCDACIGQVAALAQLNAAIDDGTDAARIDLGQQALRFASALRSAIALDTEARQLDIRTEPLFVPWKVARSVLLMMNEAVTNAVKHGTNADGDVIRVVLVSVSRDTAALTVENRTTEQRPHRAGGSGRSLIDALAAGIGGQVVRRLEKDGFSLTCRFPIPPARRPHR